MPRVLDLFCGAGGFSTGLSQAGLELVMGIDIWDKAIETYSANHPHASVCMDLQKADPVELGLDKQDVDIIVGGPPCQGFSIAGKRDRNDPRNSLFMMFVKFVDVLRPKLFLMENVPGILSMKTATAKPVKDIILEEYDKIGYEVIFTKLLASDFEVPQNRRRVFFMGKPKESTIELCFPDPILSIDQHLPVGPLLLPKDEAPANHFLSQKALDGIRNKKARSKLNGNGFGAQFLNWDKPSFTIPARFWKDGYDALVQYGSDPTLGNVRRLTVGEVGRIQTFPDDYEWKGTRKDIIVQLGNAVPCRLAYHLGRHLMGLLDGGCESKN